ncbi:3-oxoacyl-[acyl-carrier-protein] synthase-1 [Nannocystis exedens]|uniref:3-oxoacyl-[acyl-carrier-protein] synthase-1 n=1 Tax=Nannocystis exedens TaxID=54 RepID=A0A1I2HD55_9BACT|nr:hypothetical protein [Nannocystis exedens]PCC67842.1 3-oxoacyl-(acyl carrier protein) synthase [Nannocystis exedens]SFF27602.1 3-oxoacyl-[acyl-carrier-protein] synthase-1 [Nannocystis exedens]
MNPRLDVVAIGARTPVGHDAASSAAAVRAGIARCSEYPFATPDGAPLIAAADARIDPLLEGNARLEPLLASALGEVARSLTRGAPHQGPQHLLLALPEPRPGFGRRDAGELVGFAHACLRRLGIPADVRVAGHGHAGAIEAVEQAARLVADDADALCWIAGVDSWLHADTLLWLEDQRRCAQPGVRSGFIPGEAAGCIVLARPDLRRRLRLPGLAVVRGVQTAQETHLRTSEAGTFGEGMSDAVAGAASGLRLPDEQVDALYSDINGERYRSEEWGFVAMRTAAVWKSLQYEAPADRWGDVGAASVPLGAILGVQSFRRAYAPGPRAMITAGSDGGLRGALLLQRPASS